MFADTLLDLERAHLLRLMLWGGIGALTGTGILAVLAVRRARSPVLWNFGLVTAVWGGADFLAAVALRPTLALRDLAAATRMYRVLWLETGLDVCVVAVGITIAAMAWRVGRRAGALGPGVGASAVAGGQSGAHQGVGAGVSREAEMATVVDTLEQREDGGKVARERGGQAGGAAGGVTGRVGGALGAGIATSLQGAALLALHGRLLARLSGLI